MFEASKGRLKVVGRAGVGIDNVDLAAASETGCLVVNGERRSSLPTCVEGRVGWLCCGLMSV